MPLFSVFRLLELSQFDKNKQKQIRENVTTTVLTKIKKIDRNCKIINYLSSLHLLRCQKAVYSVFPKNNATS